MAVEWWALKRRQQLQKCEQCNVTAPFMIPSAKEVAQATLDNVLHHDRQHGVNPEEEIRLARARDCTDAGVRAGVKAGGYAMVASAIPTLIGTRVFPWAKANLNYTAQALIISGATIATYFITTEKTILACSRDASYARLEKERASAES